MTSRGRALVVAAFLLSAALCGTSAVALVVASRDGSTTPTALTTPSPTATPATETPTPTPSASPTPVFTVTPRPTVTAAPSPTATATASPAARATSSPRPSHSAATPAGLTLDAVLDPASGTSPGQLVKLFAHATDGDGTIRLVSVTWGDGTKSTTGKITECAAVGTADCKDFELHHTYAGSGTFSVTITIASAGTLPETSTLTIKEHVNGPSPEPSPASS